MSCSAHEKKITNTIKEGKHGYEKNKKYNGKLTLDMSGVCQKRA